MASSFLSGYSALIDALIPVLVINKTARSMHLPATTKTSLKQNFMKALLILCVVFLTVSIAPAQTKIEPSAAVTASFDKEFPGADGARWSNKNGTFGVAFNYHQEMRIAYFSPEGDLIAKGRRIEEAQLPLSVSDEIASMRSRRESKYGPLTVLNVYEFSRGGDTEYILNLENEKIALLLVSENDRVSVRKTTMKNIVSNEKSLLATSKH
jgi:hypothetical protein